MKDAPKAPKHEGKRLGIAQTTQGPIRRGIKNRNFVGVVAIYKKVCAAIDTMIRTTGLIPDKKP